MPSPAAAATICALVAYRCAPHERSDPSSWLLPAGTNDLIVIAMPFSLVIVGLLMVSRLPYPHLMYQLVKKRHSFGMLLGLLAVAGFAALEWQFALLLLTQVYLLAGFVIGVYRYATTRSLDAPKPAQIVKLPLDQNPNQP